MSAFRLALVLLLHPTYRVLIEADCPYGGTNWTWDISVYLNHECRSVNIRGVLT